MSSWYIQVSSRVFCQNFAGWELYSEVSGSRTLRLRHGRESCTLRHGYCIWLWVLRKWKELLWCRRFNVRRPFFLFWGLSTLCSALKAIQNEVNYIKRENHNGLSELILWLLEAYLMLTEVYNLWLTFLNDIRTRREFATTGRSLFGNMLQDLH